MQYILDTLGSTVIGMYFVYMIMNFNIKMSDTLNDSIVNNITNLDIIETGKLLDFDLNKVGYRNNKNETFKNAKTYQFSYYADINNNGSVDSVTYILGSSKEAFYTSNPNDKPLYRIINETDTTRQLVKDFSLCYLDSIGNKIEPISILSTQANRKLIRGLLISLSVESPMLVNGEYQFSELTKRYIPNNIN